MNPILSAHPTTVIEVMSQLARETGAVNLGQGFPDDPGPLDVRQKAAEAVVDGETGLVVGDPEDVGAVTDALAALLDDPDRRARMGVAARARAEAEFAYEVLVERLAGALP